MKIFGLINKNSGPGFHRVMMPLVMMPGIDAYITNSITPEAFEGRKPDAIFYSRVVSDEVLTEARKIGAKVIVDIDDYWHLPPGHPSYYSYIENNFAELQLKHIREADIITTTHERLADMIRPHNANVHILPNAIPHHEYFNAPRTEGERVRLFWQGSITHEADISILRNPMKRIATLPVMSVVAGYSKHEIWDSIVSTLTCGLKIPGVIKPGVDPREYYANYSYADICLAPLQGGLFNSMKSNLKVLEAGYSGLPIVCSAVNPYLDMPVLYAHNQKDWFKHVRDLVFDKDMRRVLGAALKIHCDRVYNFETINKKRYEIFEL